MAAETPALKPGHAEGFLPPVDLTNPAVFEERLETVPAPPDFKGINMFCGDDHERKTKLLSEILELWMRVSGPLRRPEKGYRVRLVNRVALEPKEAHILKVEVDQSTGQTVTFMICSAFSSRFIEFGSLVESGDFKDMHMWADYDAPWPESWPGVHEQYFGSEPACYKVLRDKIVLDQFTAAFLGLRHDEKMPIRKGSHTAEFHVESGMLMYMEYDVETSHLTDEQYTAMRGDFMQFITNGITARESTRAFAEAEKERMRKESPQVFANMLAKDLPRMMRGRDAPPIDPIAVNLLKTYAERKRREGEAKLAASGTGVVELDGPPPCARPAPGYAEPDSPDVLDSSAAEDSDDSRDGYHGLPPYVPGGDDVHESSDSEAPGTPYSPIGVVSLD